MLSSDRLDFAKKQKGPKNIEQERSLVFGPLITAKIVWVDLSVFESHNAWRYARVGDQKVAETWGNTASIANVRSRRVTPSGLAP
jgi:hypothetical protein